MGQFMEALNSQTNLDDLNLNIDSFPGGLDCNVEEVRVYFPIETTTATKNFCLKINNSL